MIIIHQRRLEKKLMASGASAKATVLVAQPTMNAVTSGTETLIRRKWELSLRVQPPGEQEFEVSYAQFLEGMSMPKAGDQLDVLYDPKDHSKVVLDPRIPEPRGVALAAAQKQARAEIAAEGGGIGVFTLGADGQLTRVGAPAAQPEDSISKLEQLADLHDRGALTDDEFAEQKQKLIGT